MARRKERKEEEFLTAKYAKSAKWDGGLQIFFSLVFSGFSVVNCSAYSLRAQCSLRFTRPHA